MVFFWLSLAAAAVTLIHVVFVPLSLPGYFGVCIAAWLAANVLFLLYYFVLGCFVDNSRPIEKKSTACLKGVKNIGQFICGYARIRISVYGQALLPMNGRFVLVSNHRSGFDPLVLSTKLGDYEIAYVSKPENMKIPLVSTIGHAAGVLPIDRENDRNALRTILQAADYIKKDFCSMAIYPEGSRSKTDELLPFHAGSFKMAQKAGVPLVIAATEGTQNIQKNFPWRSTKVEITILEVLSAEQVKNMSTKELADYARKIIDKKLRADRGLSPIHCGAVDTDEAQIAAGMPEKADGSETENGETR